MSQSIAEAASTEIQKWFQAAREDTSLQSTLNLDEILRQGSIGNTQTGDTSLRDIHACTHRQLVALGLPEDMVRDYGQRLADYRYVDEIHQLYCGRYLRWIRKKKPEGSDPGSGPGPDPEPKPPKLDMGGILSDIRFTATGVHLFSLAPQTRYPRRILYDNYLVFQQLTPDERLIYSLGAGIQRTPVTKAPEAPVEPKPSSPRSVDDNMISSSTHSTKMGNVRG
uniref:Uncharacterized protein n=1 Tax=viral metagenome TaxID=1070528 RepID=A0A6C0EKU0_9ZZZZ